MGPFVFQVPVRPRLASVDDASGERRTPSSRTKRRKRLPSRAKAMCLAAVKRPDRALHLPSIDPRPAIAAMCITVTAIRPVRIVHSAQLQRQIAIKCIESEFLAI